MTRARAATHLAVDAAPDARVDVPRVARVAARSTRAPIRPAVAPLSLALILAVAACSSTHRGFGRGKSIALHVSENVEVRCAKPVVDAARRSVTIAWLAAKTPHEKPPVDTLSLVVFDDRNGDHQPQASEILDARDNPTTSSYILFGPVAASGEEALEHLRALVRVSTRRETREINWALARRTDLY